jgi:hypothetical protein
MDFIIWLIIAGVYLAALVVLGMNTLRKGHSVLFWVGILFPVLWIVGALMPPTANARAAGAA